MILSSVAQADFPDNTIPTMAIRIKGPDVAADDIDLDLLLDLYWRHFDAVNFAGDASDDDFGLLMSLCDSSWVRYSICPSEVMQYLKEWGGSTYRYWFRSDSAFTSGSCFLQSDSSFSSVVDSCTAAVMDSSDVGYSMYEVIEQELATASRFHDYLWFYEVYDEAPSQQWRHFVLDTIPLNDYVPNMYTQDFYPAGHIRAGEPTMETISPSGIFAWQKHWAENNEVNDVPFTLDFGLLHEIDSVSIAGFNGQYHGTMHEHANSVRAFVNMEYEEPPDSNGSSELFDSPAEFILFNYYPFRLVDNDYSTTMCDSNWVFLVDHLEEALDSTVLATPRDTCPVYFYPQTIGVAGGPRMYGNGSSETLDYASYLYRNPAPQEFRMLCNLALLHQAKGIFPYNLCSYVTYPYDLTDSGNWISSSLLDRHNIRFDAPYEDWVYTGRWPECDSFSYAYIRPDSLPPWNGYDPLYSLSSAPDSTGVQGPQDYREWLCDPYGDLYTEVGSILGGIKRISPEMWNLWWCDEDYRDSVSIAYDALSAPQHFVQPRIKVFEDPGQSRCYLFYVDRFCRSNGNPYEITFAEDDLPGHAECSTRLLDHSRRFVMEGSYDAQDSTYTFLDTLDAGEARLVQLFDPEEGLSADVRITAPDVWTIHPLDSDTTDAMRATAGNSMDVVACFYNMGTSGRDSVRVWLYDSTASSYVDDVQYIDFDGLSYTPDSLCRTCDSDTVSFTWTPDSTDIGLHRMTVGADTWGTEPDSGDNRVDLTFLVNPRDYATAVRDDPWDMKEGGDDDWNTNDIDSTLGAWDSTAWSDSVSGMFEGEIEYDSTDSLFRGDVSLAVSDTPSEYIDTFLYRTLTLGMLGVNPNRPSTDPACSIFIRWKDKKGIWHPGGGAWGNLLEDIDECLGNDWDEWRELGSIDLSAISDLEWAGVSGLDSVPPAQEVWLRFQYIPDTLPPQVIQPLYIRIGWTRLEESAP